jgi:hypothetical protein
MARPLAMALELYSSSASVVHVLLGSAVALLGVVAFLGGIGGRPAGARMKARYQPRSSDDDRRAAMARRVRRIGYAIAVTAYARTFVSAAVRS